MATLFQHNHKNPGHEWDSVWERGPEWFPGDCYMNVALFIQVALSTTGPCKFLILFDLPSRWEGIWLPQVRARKSSGQNKPGESFTFIMQKKKVEEWRVHEEGMGEEEGKRRGEGEERGGANHNSSFLSFALA